MIKLFYSFFEKQPTHVSMEVHPPYYEIRDSKDNLRGCLVGTDHDLAPNVRFEPAPAMRRCLERTNVLLVEADRLAAAQIFKQHLAQKGVPPKAIEAHLQAASRKNALSMDARWEQLAKEMGKPIKGLEDPLRALRSAAKIAKEDQMTPPLQQRMCREWVVHYLMGAKMEPQDYFERCFINRQVTLPEFYSRNEVMANGIYQESQRQSIAFVAVGLGHCLGENGIPNLLRKKYGFKVIEIQANPPARIEAKVPS